VKAKLIEHADLRESRLLDRAQVERQELELVIIASHEGAARLSSLVIMGRNWAEEHGVALRAGELDILREFGIDAPKPQ